MAKVSFTSFPYPVEVGAPARVPGRPGERRYSVSVQGEPVGWVESIRHRCWSGALITEGNVTAPTHARRMDAVEGLVLYWLGTRKYNSGLAADGR